MSMIARPVPESGFGSGSPPPPPGTSSSSPAAPARRRRSESPWAMALRSGRVAVGGGILLGIVLLCLATLPWTLHGKPGLYELPSSANVRQPPAKVLTGWFGYDHLGRSMLARCLLGGVISL